MGSFPCDGKVSPFFCGEITDSPSFTMWDRKRGQIKTERGEVGVDTHLKGN